MTTPLTFKNFCTEFVIKPFDKRLSLADQKKALKYSIITGICFAALLHLSALTYQCFGKIFFKVSPPKNNQEPSPPGPSPSNSVENLKLKIEPTQTSPPPASESLQPSKSFFTSIPDREVALLMLSEATEGDKIYSVLRTPIDAPHDPLQNPGIPLTFWDLMNYPDFKKVLLEKIPHLTSQQAYYILSDKECSTHYPSTFLYKHNKLTEVVCLLLEQLSEKHLAALFILPCSLDPKNHLLKQTLKGNYFKPLLIKYVQTDYVRMLKRSIFEKQRADPEYRRALFEGQLKIV